MKRAIKKIRPASGFSSAIYFLLTILVPLLVYVFVRIELAQLAIAIIILSKWRMFAVRPRYWLANIQANAIDILIGVSLTIFMVQTNAQIWQVIWAIAYTVWLLLIKPSNSLTGTSLQALLGQTLGMTAVYLAWGDASAFVLVLMTWFVCYVAAKHFFTSFDEPLTRFLSNTWAFFGASVSWIMSHWLLYYGLIAQPVLLLSVISFGLAAMYFLQQSGRLSDLVRRQFVFIMVAIIVVVLVFSEWGDKAV